MSNEGTPKNPREQYRLRARLIHGSFGTGRWDYDDLRAIRQVVDRLRQGRAEAEKSASWWRILSPRPTASALCSTASTWLCITKDLGGFGTEMGGVVIGSGTYFNFLVLYRKDFGGRAASQECVADPGVRLAGAGGAHGEPAKKRDAGGRILLKCGAWSVQCWQTLHSANGRNVR
jgi:hypothetical protein